MQTESLALGVVKTIAKFHVDICLPHGECGRMQIYDVNDRYTELLCDVVKSGKLGADVTSLSEMFHVGQVVQCLVKEKASEDLSGNMIRKKLHTLSLNPKLINKHVVHKNIKPKMHFVGYIDSIEDHGYILEGGIPGVRCFLPTEPGAEKLKLGSLVVFTPHIPKTNGSASGRVMKVSAVTECDVLKYETSIHFSCLLPGMSVEACVVKKIDSTIWVGFGGMVISVNRAHYIGNENDYRIGNHVTVCIILIDPATKQITGSMLPHLVSSVPNVTKIPNMRKQLSVGTRFSDAVVERVDKRTIHVMLPKTKGLKAVIRKSDIPDKIAGSNLKSKFEVASELSCRIIDYDLFENAAIATMKKKLLKLPFLSLDELRSAELVNAVVSRFTPSGVAVRVESRLHGLIPYLHLFDVPQKNPSDKIMRGQQLSCRVLQIDKSVNKLILTAKPALVDAQYPIFGSPQMCSLLTKHEMQPIVVVCVVVLINNRGLLLAGVDNIRGWLPKAETALDADDMLQVNYYPGQVLHARLLREFKINKQIQPSKNQHLNKDQCHVKYLLSLKINTPLNISRFVETTKTKLYPPGTIFRVTVKHVQHKGLVVNLFSLETNSDDYVGIGYLTFDHLSDFDTNQSLFCQSMKKSLKDDSTLNLDQKNSPRQVVLINQSKSTLLVSAKPTLLSLAKELQNGVADNGYTMSVTESSTGFVRSFDDLKIGTQWFGWVARHANHGVFIQFPSGVRALAPMRYLSEHRVPAHVKWANLLPIGTNVIAKIVELNQSEKCKCIVSLRMLDTYFAHEHYLNITLRTLNSWFSEREWLAQRFDNFGGFRIGDQIQFQVDKVDDLFIYGAATKVSGNSNNHVRALAYIANTVNVLCVENTIYPGIVSFVDLECGRIEVVLSTWLLNSMKNRQENKLTELKPGQQIFSVVIAYRSRDVAVVALRGHASGRLGVLPARRSFNDFVGGNSWSVGQRNKVTLREPIQQTGTSTVLQLCTLTIYDPIDKSNQSNKHQQSSVTGKKMVKLAKGDSLKTLYFHKLVKHTAFFKLSLHSDQLVICHMNNWDSTSKAIRCFINSPPEVNSLVERTATVLHPATNYKHAPKSHRTMFNGKLAEISYLETNQISIGSMVCVELLHNLHNYWLVRLPAGLYGRLHVTSVAYSIRPKLLDLTNTDKCTIPNIRQYFDGFDREAFITCRVIDQIKLPAKSAELHQYEKRLPTNKGYVNLCYVSNKNNVLRDENQCKSTAPELGVPIGAIVKCFASNWLLLSITHSLDILVPISTDLQSKLETAKIKFQIGDFLQVYPVVYVEDHLVGHLLTKSQLSDEFSDNRILSVWVKEILTNLKYTTDRAKQSLVYEKRKLFTSDSPNAKEPATKRICPSVGNELSPNTRLEVMDSVSVINHSDVTDKMDVDMPTGNMYDKQLLMKYQHFMIPRSADTQHSEQSASESNIPSIQLNHRVDIKRTDPVTVEWDSRQLELRNALLAALTNEQQPLGKDTVYPKTTEEFELAVRNAPSKAAYWTAYMSFVLASSLNGKLGQHDSLHEARTIAERAIRIITNSVGPDQRVELARLLLFYLIMEAKELERLNQQFKQQSYAPNIFNNSTKLDPVLEADEQSKRVSQVLMQLLSSNQSQFIRRGIEVLSDTNQHDRAEKLSRGLVKSSPTDVNYWLTLVKVRFRAGQAAAAREAQRNAGAILKAASLPQLSLGLARLEFDYGDVDRAIGLLSEQLKVTPKRKQLYEECIKLLLLNGKHTEAKAIQKQAVENLKPTDCVSIKRLCSD